MGNRPHHYSVRFLVEPQFPNSVDGFVTELSIAMLENKRSEIDYSGIKIISCERNLVEISLTINNSVNTFQAVSDISETVINGSLLSISTKLDIGEANFIPTDTENKLMVVNEPRYVVKYQEITISCFV